MTVTDDLTRVRPELFINGSWGPGSEGSIAVLDPATGEHLLDLAAAGVADIDAAVGAARSALDGEWGRMPGAARGRILNRVADLIERDGDYLAWLEARDIGKPAAFTRMVEIENAIATWRHFAGWADKINGDTIPTAGFMGRPAHSYTVREPVGVIGAIVPWNVPIMIAGWKLAPALACGNTIVVKPAEEASLSLLHLAGLLQEAGVPDGVVNVVPGLGEVAGAALVEHSAVDKISFTGSPEVGRLIQVKAAETFKRVTLELGGKSPQIVLPDADLDAAVQGLAMGLFYDSGEVCAAGTRVLVHRSIQDQVVEGLAAAAKGQVLGSPLAPETTMGPLISDAHRRRVLSYVERGRSEGAQLVTGGGSPQGGGFFVEPTIFAGVDNRMTIAQEEIFGPVGSVIAFDDVDDAIRIANDTKYGLAATIWTRDVSHAHVLAGKVRAGSVWVNGWGALDPALPWGGMKTSGVGRELGWAGILANTEEKVIRIIL